MSYPGEDERCHGTGIQPFDGDDSVEIECPGCVDCLYDEGDWGEQYDDEMEEAEYEANNWEGWDGP